MRQYPSSSTRRATRQTSRSQRSVRHRGEPVSPPSSLHSVPVWRSPILWLGLLAVLIVGAIPVINWYRTVRVIAVLASDVSDSGLADPSIGKEICRAQTQALKPNDMAIDLFFADTTEPTRSSPVDTVTKMFTRCNIFDNQQPRPDTVGKGAGTSPTVLLERIQTQIQIQRRAGNTNPVAAVIWLQAAEPGPGLPELDFTVLGEQIRQVTEHQGQVTIIGPTGTLRQELEYLSVENPNLQICTVAEHQVCIKNAFAAARAHSAPN